VYSCIYSLSYFSLLCCIGSGVGVLFEFILHLFAPKGYLRLVFSRFDVERDLIQVNVDGLNEMWSKLRLLFYLTISLMLSTTGNATSLRFELTAALRSCGLSQSGSEFLAKMYITCPKTTYYRIRSERNEIITQQTRFLSCFNDFNPSFLLLGIWSA
jgi:hypothetical protein